MSTAYVKTYDFTASCKSIEQVDVVDLLNKHCKKWCFQKEKGADSGFEHFQGRMSLKTKTRLNSAIKLFPGWHLSVTSKANADNNFYVTKEDTRVDGPWSSEDENSSNYIPRQIRDIKNLYPWQQTVIDDAAPDKFDTRTINVIVDISGNHGKSILKTWIEVHGIGCALPYANDYKDLMRAVMDRPTRRLYIVDMPRAIKKEQLFQFYSGIEDIKNGVAWDDRYHFRQKFFDCPNIWVFTNTVPDFSLLSKDRWRLWGFDADNALVRMEIDHSKPTIEETDYFPALRCNTSENNPINKFNSLDQLDHGHFDTDNINADAFIDEMGCLEM